MIPRLRMFAGPNGSGKSTLKELIPSQLLGVYINADEIEKRLRDQSFLDLQDFAIDTCNEEISCFFDHSELFAKANIEHRGSWAMEGTVLRWLANDVNSYHASVLSDFIRHQLANTKQIVPLC